MVLGLLSLATTVPLLATSAINLQDSAQKHQNGSKSTSSDQNNDWKTDKCHLRARCTKRMNESRKTALDRQPIVLRDGGFYISSPKTRDREHPFTGYSLPFPEKDYLGLVSTISDDPPMLNWIYIDRETYGVRYGVRKVAETQLVGPFDYKVTQGMTIVRSAEKTERQGGEKRIKFRNLEGFVAVEEEEGVWKLYFDVDNDGLKQVEAGKSGKRNAEVELLRVSLEESDSDS